MSYEINGEQYIAVAAGRGLQPYYQPNYSRLLAFKLGGKRATPPIEYTPPALIPPPSTASAAVLARGAEAYGQYCVQCPATRSARSRTCASLRALHSQELFDAIVLGGARAADGMASFAEGVTQVDAQAVRAYIITLAIEQKAYDDARQAAEARAAGSRDGDDRAHTDSDPSQTSNDRSTAGRTTRIR